MTDVTGWPGVGRILRATGLAPDLSSVDPDVLTAAFERGRGVHAACEGHHYGFDIELEPEWRGFYDGYLCFCDETKHVPIRSEYNVYSRRWRFKGRLDRTGLITLAGYEGRRTILDWKTGDAAGVEVQMAAYMLAHNEMHPTEPVELAAAVALRRNGTYRVHPVDIEKPMAHGFTPRQVWFSAVVNWWARNGR